MLQNLKSTTYSEIPTGGATSNARTEKEQTEYKATRKRSNTSQEEDVQDYNHKKLKSSFQHLPSDPETPGDKTTEVTLFSSCTRGKGMFGAKYSLTNGPMKRIWGQEYPINTPIYKVLQDMLDSNLLTTPTIMFRGVYLTKLHLDLPLFEDTDTNIDEARFTHTNDMYTTSDKKLFDYDEDGRASLNPTEIPWTLEEALYNTPVEPNGFPVGVFPGYGCGSPPPAEWQNVPENIIRCDDGKLYNISSLYKISEMCKLMNEFLGRTHKDECLFSSTEMLLKYHQHCQEKYYQTEMTCLSKSINRWAFLPN